uniref:TATA-box binding protein associated factor 8 n=1 Tax=Ovis aries TaxID=9940 RepID=A0AC11D602_SHEEP
MADAAATAGAAGSGTRSGSKQSTNPADNYHLARRRTLQVVVSSLLTEAGFESAEKASVETLTEMLQSYISEIGRSAKSYCEHTARTQPTLSDIVVTLVEMGFNVDTLPAYAKRSQRMVITAPPVTNQPVTPKALTAGQNRPHPPHIPSHFPEFPDPHTYIKTPLQSFPASASLPVSQFFTSGGQSIGVSSSVLPMNIQDFLYDGLVGSPCRPRDCQESSPTP